MPGSLQLADVASPARHLWQPARGDLRAPLVGRAPSSGQPLLRGDMRWHTGELGHRCWTVDTQQCGQRDHRFAAEDVCGSRCPGRRGYARGGNDLQRFAPERQRPQRGERCSRGTSSSHPPAGRHWRNRCSGHRMSGATAFATVWRSAQTHSGRGGRRERARIAQLVDTCHGHVSETLRRRRRGCPDGTRGRLAVWKPIGSFPGDGSGNPVASPARNPMSWTAVGLNGGMPAPGAVTRAFALCARADRISLIVFMGDDEEEYIHDDRRVRPRPCCSMAVSTSPAAAEAFRKGSPPERNIPE